MSKYGKRVLVFAAILGIICIGAAMLLASVMDLERPNIIRDMADYDRDGLIMVLILFAWLNPRKPT